MAEPNITELVTMVARSRTRKLADNVSNSNALLMHISRSGNVQPVSGGRTIVQELEYAENSTFKYYAGYEVLDISPSQVFDAAEYNWKQAAVVVSVSGLEGRVQASGKEELIPLVRSRIRNAERTMANQLSNGVYSDGTGSGGKEITGLQTQVSDTAAGSPGGIARATFSFWQNQKLDPVGDGAGAMSSTTVQANMKKLDILCRRGNDKPNVWIADANYFEYFWTSLTDIQRINDTRKGNSGFDELAFAGASVMYDGDSGIPADHMYALNTDYIHWRPHVRTNMVPLERRDSLNQDSYVVPIVFAGNLTMSNASLQGVITDVNA